ncbi:MAG: phosphatidate cytidylyltransferase [Cytophagales bacterium]|jgi:phosphatidate cytidylyltransferase|nr:phosphatidate cytidylyltransferase [Cytophagales bacterium]
MEDNDLVKRITSVAVLLPVLLFFVFFSIYTCDSLFLGLIIVMLYEYEKIFSVHKVLMWLTIAVGVLFYLTEFMQNFRIGNDLKLCSVFPLLVCGLFFRKNGNNTILDALESVSGVLYISFPFCLLRRLALVNSQYEASVILGILSLVWSNDTFAYFFGRTFGKHKLFPTISPKKTVEGLLGGLFGVVMCMGVLGYVMKIYTQNFWILCGVLVMIFGTLGDLVASALKRYVSIKDFGTLIPGHGGFLDRFDSLIFVIPYIYLAYTIFMW